MTVMALPAGSVVAGVFTQNRFPAPPVRVCRRHLPGGVSGGVRALAINAGIANAGTLGEGVRDAEESCRLLARLLGCRPREVLPFSTGVIMERLPMDRYADGLVSCVRRLEEDNWLAVARAIMTTDTVAKGVSRRVGKATITGVAKGSGMIHPNMATMLAFVATDAAVDAKTLAGWQREIVGETFNAISVDGDTSTNDSFVLIATGGCPLSRDDKGRLRGALFEVCAALAEAIVRDGEGARKLVTVTVAGGRTRSVCKRVAEAVARSLLVKTALAAGDANVGRLLMAIGNAGEGFSAAAVHCRIGRQPVIAGGGLDPRYDEGKVTALLAKDEVGIYVTIGGSRHVVSCRTCDLTHRYIDINASYRS